MKPQPPTLIDQSKKIIVAMSAIRHSPQTFLDHRAYVVTFDFEAPKGAMQSDYSKPWTVEATRFVGKLRNSTRSGLKEVQAEPSDPILDGSRVRQTIVFGTSLNCDHAFWNAFPWPPKKARAKISWSLPMRYRDLNILWR